MVCDWIWRSSHTSIEFFTSYINTLLHKNPISVSCMNVTKTDVCDVHKSASTWLFSEGK